MRSSTLLSGCTIWTEMTKSQRWAFFNINKVLERKLMHLLHWLPLIDNFVTLTFRCLWVCEDVLFEIWSPYLLNVCANWVFDETRTSSLNTYFAKNWEAKLERQIIQEELLAVLTMMVGANISPEQLLSIAERTILEADEDKDELISFEEFVKVQLL